MSQASGVSIGQVYAYFGISRQAHHQQLRRLRQREAEEALVLELVRAMRFHHPRLGGRKLWRCLPPQLARWDMQMGRDHLFDLLRRHYLLVPVHRRRTRTTRSGLWRCPNLVPELTLQRAGQLWVGDITYLTLEGGFAYLCLLTDAFSRFIVGFDLSTSLAVEGCQRALTMALAQARPPLAGLIHHSDHGIQYTAHAYQGLLQQHAILPSMGQVGNCYENALAERMNGILKLEYGLDSLFVDLAQATLATQQAVWLYNHERPHLALNYRVPAQVHLTPC